MSELKFLLQRVDKDEIKMDLNNYTCKLSPFDADLQKVGQYLTQAILLEVSTHPKPGLVTRLSNGAHKDMSIFYLYDELRCSEQSVQRFAGYRAGT